MRDARGQICGFLCVLNPDGLLLSLRRESNQRELPKSPPDRLRSGGRDNPRDNTPPACLNFGAKQLWGVIGSDFLAPKLTRDEAVPPPARRRPKDSGGPADDFGGFAKNTSPCACPWIRATEIDGGVGWRHKAVRLIPVQVLRPSRLAGPFPHRNFGMRAAELSRAFPCPPCGIKKGRRGFREVFFSPFLF